MIDITHKSNTLRTAVASAVLKCGKSGVSALKKGTVPKGDVITSAKIACFLAVKNTSNVLPHCHPLPVEYTDVKFEVRNKEIIITVEVKTIYKTGCEMEALHGASVAALTVYDMLKPIEKDIEITLIKLLKKSGGKSGRDLTDENIKAAVIVVSDSVYAKKSKDTSGKFLKDKLEKHKNISVKKYIVVPDDREMLLKKIKELCQSKTGLIITTGGTGVSKKDITPDTVREILTEEVEGIMETARAYGQDRMPYAMFSNGVAGYIDDTLILTFPGSLNAAKEYLNALFPHVLHLFKVRRGLRH